LLLPEDLPLPIETPAADRREGRPRPSVSRRRPPDDGAAGAGVANLRDLEREQVIRALAHANGVQAKAAALLGITPRQLGYRLRKYGVVREFRLGGEARILHG
jgi:Nif-specific regulatory protein